MIFVIAALATVLIYIYTDWFFSLRNKALDLVTPFYWVSDLPAKAEDWADRPLKSRARLIQENAALRTDLLILRRKLQKMAALTAQNVRLRQLMNSADTLDDHVLIAEIIGVSPDPMVHLSLIHI